MTDERQVYAPIVERLYFYKRKLVTVVRSTGHSILFDLDGEYVTDFSWTEDDRKLRYVGKLIKPRWKKQRLVWQDVG